MVNRAMKDSGVEWIGNIPVNWEVKPLKYVADIQTGNTPSMKNKNYYSDNGIEWIKTNNLLGTNGVSESEVKLSIEGSKTARIAKAQSTLVSCIGDVGKIGYITSDSAYNQQINAVSFYEGDVYWKYGMYYLSVQKEQHQYYQNGNVLKILNTDNHKRIVMPIPKLNEQQKIAAFLDEKVAHIDNIIEETKKSIENLKAYKQSLITETVTKGLNPNVEMKDSGIDWIGDIPKYWKIYKIGQIFKEHKEKNEGLIEDNLLSLSYGKVKRRDIKSKEGLLPQSFEGYNIIKPGDIVLRMTDLQNDQKSLRVGLCKEKGIITSAYISIRAYNNIYPHYAYYYLHSFDIYKGFYGMGAGVRQGVNFNELKKLDILFPTYDEQKQIAIFLDEKSKTIDSTIEQKEQLITELEAYKKSLIYEYVTGKKEVK